MPALSVEQVFRAFELGLISKAEARRLLDLEPDRTEEVETSAAAVTRAARSTRRVGGRPRGRGGRVELPNRPAWLAYLLGAYVEAVEKGEAHRQAVAVACRDVGLGTQSWPDVDSVDAVIDQVDRFFEYWSENADLVTRDQLLDEALAEFSIWLVDTPAPGGAGRIAEHLAERWLSSRRPAGRKRVPPAD